MERISCFKAYDIRGQVPRDLNEDLVYRLGRGFAALFSPGSVALGRDIRLSSPALALALSRGFQDSGVDVCDIGICGTEMVYFAVPHLALGGGIMITASHNPPEYNGIKLVREHSIPVSGDSGLRDLESLVAENAFPPPPERRGSHEQRDITEAFISHLLGFIDVTAIRPLKVVANGGNGCAGPLVERLADRLPVEMVRLHFTPDGSFPHGVPNPLLPENRLDTSRAVLSAGADLGVAWDGDYDRCFFFDEKGEFIEGYYIVGLLAKAMLMAHPGEKIIHDPRLTWNTVSIVKGAGGTPVLSKTGHAFIKERMRKENALYGGEMSAHHYFRDNFFCDSGMIPFLLVLSLLSKEGKPLSSLIHEMKEQYPVSGEINMTVENPGDALRLVESRFIGGIRDYTDGLSIEFDRWRFNVRPSNTEPLLRLNVETRGDRTLLAAKTTELLALLGKEDKTVQ
ncbi:MAG: phosphomannomutase [Candidatus Eremiobacteraeota bacterium]|nr:phosphomannomutase [Candidatus Eremiobacteraeota bacterium]